VLVNYSLGPDNLNVFLYSDSNGLPGTEIEQIGFDLAVSSSGGIVTADSLATSLTLTAGSTYWLVLAPASSDTFINWLNGGSSAPLAASSIGGAPFVSDGDFSAQFQIDGGPVTSTVPEPSSLWLLGAVTGLFCVTKRLKSRRLAMIS
jgi:PEP-CTERM motif